MVHWSIKTRYYNTITGSFVGGNPDNGREITAGTEAFAAVAFMCNRAKWNKMHELHVPGKSFNIIKNADKIKRTNPRRLDLFYETHPELVPNWTDSNVGQAKYGGWSQEGLKKFADLCQVLKAARKKKTSVALEKKILAALRTEHDITAKDHDAHRKSLGYGKKSASVASMPQVKGLFDDSDSD